MRVIGAALIALAALGLATPASAGWRLVESGAERQVSDGKMYVNASGDWNRSNIDIGKRGESWTRDGPLLNDLSFFGKIKPGESMLKTRDKKRRPLPLFEADFLPTDIVDWFRDTANIVLGGSLFEVTKVEPAKLAGYPGVHFGYSYTGGDNVERLGEVRAAVIDGRLYLISFDAPRLHYFEKDIADVRAIMDSAHFR